jgi:hypothetical protein
VSRRALEHGRLDDRSRRERLAADRVAFDRRGLKKAIAISVAPFGTTLSTNSLLSSISACVWESAFTPTATSGGVNEACVTQLIVAAASRPSLPAALNT